MAALVRSWENTEEGSLLFTPDRARQEASNLATFMRWLADKKGVHVDGYAALHAWSVNEVEAFWLAVWEFFELRSATAIDCVLTAHAAWRALVCRCEPEFCGSLSEPPGWRAGADRCVRGWATGDVHVRGVE